MSQLRPRRPRRPRAPGPLLAAFGAAACLGLPAPGAADSGDGPLPPAVARRLVAEPDRGRPRPPAWLGENVHFKKGAGLEYRQQLSLGSHPLQLGFQGPVVRKKKSLGLTVEVRF